MSKPRIAGRGSKTQGQPFEAAPVCVGPFFFSYTGEEDFFVFVIA
jgi:hypothetical protein